jgi:hypothetical protein
MTILRLRRTSLAKRRSFVEQKKDIGKKSYDWNQVVD